MKTETTPPKAALKCQGEGCTNVKAWGFRDVGFWKGKSENLCDECYGHKFGDFTCSTCQRNCYEEDFDEKTQTHICGKCKREELELDKSIERDMEHQKHGL